MIVLASDYVGFKIVEYVVERGEEAGIVAIDPADRGGYNARIAGIVKTVGRGLTLIDSGELDKAEFLDRLTQSRPPLGILAWWPRILKGRLLSIPTRGWLNVHPGLLPFNRGKNPNFWCLADGTPCGVSLHFIDKGVDTGPVVAQAPVPVTWEDTGETVYHRSRERILELFRERYADILSGVLAAAQQDLAAGNSHRSEEMDELSRIQLDRTYTARRLFNIIRARMFPPHPTAYFEDGGKRYSVRIQIEEMDDDISG